MASGSLKSIAVAAEASFGSIAAANGIPDASVLSFAGFDADRANIGPFGESEIIERIETRSVFGGLPPEPVALYDVTAAVKGLQRKGTVTVVHGLRTIGAGTAYATYDLTPLGRILASGLIRVAATAATVTCNDALNADDNNVDLTAAQGASVKVGDIFAVSINGRTEFAGVTGRVVDNITYSPSTSIALTTQVLRLCDVWIPYYAGGSLGASVALRIDGDGWRSYAVGCRLQSLRLFSENGAVKAEMILQCAGIYDDNSAYALSEPTRASGARLIQRGSYALMSATVIGSTVPAVLNRSVLSIDGWEAKFENTLADVGAASNHGLGVSNYEVADFVASLTVNLASANATVDTFVRDQEIRSFLMGCGSNGPILGNAGCVYMPAGFLTADALRTGDTGALIKQALNLQASPWGLDDGSANAANSPFRLALGN